MAHTPGPLTISKIDPTCIMAGGDLIAQATTAENAAFLVHAATAYDGTLAALRHAASVLATPSSDPRVARVCLDRIAAAIAKAEGRS